MTTRMLTIMPTRRAPFVAMLERAGAFPIPKEMIAVVCAFWLRAGEY